MQRPCPALVLYTSTFGGDGFIFAKHEESRSIVARALLLMPLELSRLPFLAP
eukprot:COSAG04_NODE_2002_length_5029_cov_5.314604_5_plen_52_part_00